MLFQKVKELMEYLMLQMVHMQQAMRTQVGAGGEQVPEAVLAQIHHRLHARAQPPRLLQQHHTEELISRSLVEVSWGLAAGQAASATSVSLLGGLAQHADARYGEAGQVAVAPGF